MRRILLAAAMLLVAMGRDASAAPITTPGDYELTSGLVGTFTSTGSGMSVFSFTGPQGFVWDNLNPLQFETTNTANAFESTYFFAGVLRIDWDGNTWLFQPETCPAGDCSERGTLTYRSAGTVPSVPEPAMLALVALGALRVGTRRRNRSGRGRAIQGEA